MHRQIRKTTVQFINENQWYFVYIGVDHQLGKYGLAFFSKNQESYKEINLIQQLPNNENLGKGFTLFIGGSSDRPSRNCNKCFNLIGYTYNSRFYYGEYMSQNGFYLMFNGLDSVLQLENRLKVYYENTIVQYGDILDQEDPKDPLIDEDRIKFDDDRYLKFFYKKGQSHYLNWNMRIEQDLNEILNVKENSDLIFGLKMVNSQLVVYNDVYEFKGNSVLQLNQWYNIHINVLLFELNTIEVLIDGNEEIRLKILNDQYNYFRQEYLDILIGHGQFVIQQFKIGDGGYMTQDQQCKLMLGSTYCLLCSNQLMNDGECLDDCLIGYYKSNMNCIKCMDECEQCSVYNKCDDCQELFPGYLDSYCLQGCEYGYSDVKDNECSCHRSCQECKIEVGLDGELENVCVRCQDEKQYLYKQYCVDECIYGTYADSSTMKCIEQCPKFYSINQCYDTCPILAYQQNCVDSCPDQYYDLNGLCTKCQSPCKNCIKANFCTTCIDINSYAHEVIGVCHTNCYEGFFLSGKQCRVCEKDCEVCPVNYYLTQNKNCVVDCGIGYIGLEGICQPLDYPIVIIENKPQAIIGRRQDLILQSKIYLHVGTIETIEWSLVDDDFFKNTINGLEYLVIPKDSLIENKQYNLQIVVKSSNGNTGSDSLIFQTSKAIKQGEFSVKPESGVSFDTPFKMEFNNFIQENKLYYDGVYYQQKIMKIGEKEIEVQNDIHQIFINQENEGVYEWQFEQQQEKMKWIVELKVYNEQEEMVLKQEVKVNASKQLVLEDYMELLLTPVDNDTIEELLYKTQLLKYFNDYERVKDNQRQYEMDYNLVDDYLHFNYRQCNDLLQCRQYGQCNRSQFSDFKYQCDCYWSKQGDFCTFTKQNLLLSNQLYYLILHRLLIIESDEQLLKSQIAINLVSTLDALSVKSYDEYYQFVETILSQQDLSLYSAINLLDAISQLLYLNNHQPKQIPDTIIQYNNQFNSLFNQLITIIQANHISLNTIHLYSLKYTTLLFYASDSSQLDTQFPNTIPLNRFILDYPISQLPSSTLFHLYLSSWHFTPQYTPNYQSITTYALFQIKNYYTHQPIPLSHFLIYLSKKASYPPINHTTNLLYTTPSSCQYISENEYYIQINCTQYQPFTIYPNILEFTGEKPLTPLLAQYVPTNDIDSQIYLSHQPYIYPELASESPEHDWINFNFYFSIVIISLYLILAIVLLTCIKIEQIRHENDVHLLTYQPLLSLSVFGHTPESLTYFMRFSKFFILIHAYICFLSVSFTQLNRVNPKLSYKQLSSYSILFSIFMTCTMTYFIELLYYLIKKHILNSNILYLIICLIMHIAMAVFGIYSHGYIQDSFKSYYIYSFLVLLGIDLLILDNLIVCYAFCNQENALLRFFAFRGFYVKPGLYLESDLSMVSELESRDEKQVI